MEAEKPMYSLFRRVGMSEVVYTAQNMRNGDKIGFIL